MIKLLLIILQIAAYYLLESLLIGIILYIAWITIGTKFCDINLNYLNCTLIVWLFKLMKFNLFQFYLKDNIQYNNIENKEAEM